MIEPTASAALIVNLATRCRTALAEQRIRPAPELVVLRHFPKGCCKPASLLLARLLMEEIKLTFLEFVEGHTGGINGSSHFWIVLDTGRILDITGNQFDDVDTQVIFTSDTAWYDRFVEQTYYPYNDVMIFNEKYGADFNATYESLRLAIGV